MSLISHSTAVNELEDVICHISLEEVQNRIAIQYHDHTPDPIQQYINARLEYEFSLLNCTQPAFDPGVCFTTPDDFETLFLEATRAVTGVYYDNGKPRVLVNTPLELGYQRIVEDVVEQFCKYVTQMWCTSIGFEPQLL